MKVKPSVELCAAKKQKILPVKTFVKVAENKYEEQTIKPGNDTTDYYLGET